MRITTLLIVGAWSSDILSILNFLNIWTPKKIVVIILKVEQDGFSLE